MKFLDTDFRLSREQADALVEQIEKRAGPIGSIFAIRRSPISLFGARTAARVKAPFTSRFYKVPGVRGIKGIRWKRVGGVGATTLGASALANLAIARHVAKNDRPPPGYVIPPPADAPAVHKQTFFDPKLFENARVALDDLFVHGDKAERNRWIAGGGLAAATLYVVDKARKKREREKAYLDYFQKQDQVRRMYNSMMQINLGMLEKPPM
jgi:hypothetical protein